MEITTKIIHQAVVIKLHGQLNTESCEQFKTAILNLIAQGYMTLIVDCKLLEFISSAGIRSLYLAYDKLKESGGKLYLCSPNDDVDRILRMVDLQAEIPIYSSQKDALKASTK